MSQPTGWTIRQSEQSDTHLMRGLLASADWLHQHLDWLSPTELLEKKPFLIAFEKGLPIACLALPPDTPEIAWVRLFASTSSDPAETWKALWDQARDKSLKLGVDSVYALITDAWMASLIRTFDFMHVNDVITLEWRGKHPAESDSISGELREMAQDDIPAVMLMDHLAFEPPWRLSQETLKAAYHQIGLASVIEIDGEIAGYQISTQSAFGIHLARIAVHPVWQDQSLGKLLIGELQRQSISRGFDSITVNTQADNLRSQRLYSRLGFRETGHAFPVYRASISSLELDS
jgi:ribosomal protein S18 acetylase RimI-like enzyme